jgi:predicted nucleic acid-binding protein
VQASAEVLVVDANIPMRAVLGSRVRTLIAKYAGAGFYAPDTAWAEAREHLPAILRKRDVPVEAALLLLNSFKEIIQPVGFEMYGQFESRRLARPGDGARVRHPDLDRR